MEQILDSEIPEHKIYKDRAIWVATYWKNGTAVPLSDSTTTIASAQSIFVPVTKYWKNGIPVSLADGAQYAGANSSKWKRCVRCRV